ncbi:LysR family transcriptional regulator [Ramlibacter sp. AW1]|uniref:LysR family transcriptional regulator n=1 Tax=Ramlibacter aurantiacus TaxID=2801330 RepID=A0A936ZLD2_9BURK|nr:LysR family transcriptional regulator [Ramlibacter aurantiacus]MBL0421937.1 LysR family transcriptional regulator [Ramlibacter aurantiacus]
MEYLRAIHTFLQAVKYGNFSATARHLHITPQAVSHQVSQLESWLDVRLFNRTTRKISLTAEGSALFERCNQGMETIEDGVRQLRERNEAAAGLVRLAVPFGLSQALLVDLLPQFMEQHPRIAIELIIGNELPDVVGQSIDVGIVGGEVPMASLVVRRIASFRLVLCAATSYLQRHGVPQTLEDLRHHRCVHLRHHRTGKNLPWTFQRGDEVVTLDLPGALTVDDTESHRRAVLNGAGIGQLASFFVAPQVRSGHLQALGGLGYTAPPIGLYLYLPNRLHMPRKNRLLADFLYDQLTRHPDLQAAPDEAAAGAPRIPSPTPAARPRTRRPLQPLDGQLLHRA